MTYHTILLSMDTETGRRRRGRLNWQPTEHLVAVSGDEAPEAFRRRARMRHNVKPATLCGVVGCAWSHVLALRRVVEADLRHVLVLEDDARAVAALPPPDALPWDDAVHLGGALRTPGSWAAQAREFPVAKEIEVWRRLTPGLHALEGFSIVGSEALYVPNASVARRILAVAEDPGLPLTHWDLFLRKHRLVRYLWAPNCFAVSDPEASQIEGRPLLRDFYAGGVRRIERRRALALALWPSRGGARDEGDADEREMAASAPPVDT